MAKVTGNYETLYIINPPSGKKVSPLSSQSLRHWQKNTARWVK
jgi:hypothetical protein